MIPSVSSLISFSWQRTKELLFPFNFKRWIKILFIVWLSGQAAGMGGNFNFPGQQQAAQPDQQEEIARPLPTPSIPANQTAAVPSTDLERLPADEQVPDSSADESENDQLPPVNPVMVIAIILLVIPFALFFGWLSARFNFILIDFLVNRDVRIKESFRAHKTAGNSYFLFSLSFGLTAMGILIVLALLFALAASAAKILLWLLIPLFIFSVLALVIIGITIIDFVLPIMHQDKIKAVAACKKFLSFKPNWKEIGLYILLKMALGIAAGIVSLIVAVIAFAGAAIAALVIAIPGGILAGVAPFLKPLLIGIGSLLLVVGVLALILLVGLITLPIPIFFRTLALSYLFRLFPDYNLLGFSPSNPSS